MDNIIECKFTIRISESEQEDRVQWQCERCHKVCVLTSTPPERLHYNCRLIVKEYQASFTHPGLACTKWKKIEGPKAWAFMHREALNSRPDFISMVAELCGHIGCMECRQEALNYLKQNPPPIGAVDWFKWTVDWHNSVNMKLDKSIISVEDARKIYEN